MAASPPGRSATGQTDCVKFRRATAADIPAVVALVESAYRGETSTHGWTTEAHLLDGRRTDAEEVAGIITGATSDVLLAEDDELVACCQIDHADAVTAYFGMFAVRPGLQGRGIGRIVLAESERRALLAGATRQRMTVIRQRADLIAWYERLGYFPTGVTVPWPYGDERYGQPKVDDLEFVELAKDLPLAASRTTAAPAEGEHV
ncbi:MAG: GNAT family N-acetyltransferase [Acidimicrobiaceae bacterium]|nr:GNAT family N-acetyltransferase [Acidimicrobiaceae bacterium]